MPRASFAVGLEAATTVSPQLELGLRARAFPDVEWAAELGFDALFSLAPNLNFELRARAAMPVTRYRFTVEGSDESLFVQSVISGIAQVGLELHFGAR